MDSNKIRKNRILIVDDSELNRALLNEMLHEEFDVTEVENGAQAVEVLQKHSREYSLVLLDIVMPEMDGFEVLAYMNKYHWIEDVPVIMISSENSPSFIRHAYEFGATDFINRPFDAAIVHQRVVNTITLYAKQRRLMDIVADQIYEKEKNSSLMVSILSHIVEFRNGESGLHVLHINALTEMLLKQLIRKTDRYGLTKADVTTISTASALHDIGKISIDDKILNKPGRLTPEEFEIMKTHSAIGASMLTQLKVHQDEALVKRAYEICRWHHERYDGRGYPDGLKGDEIPISAQIVALADVYDALTSERCYKKAFPHEEAMRMIMAGECGAFNPLVLECLEDIAEDIRKELKISSYGWENRRAIENLTEEMIKHEELSSSARLIQQLECERIKVQYLFSIVKDITFVYTAVPPVLSLSKETSQEYGVVETVADPLNSEQFRSGFEPGELERIQNLIRSTTPEQPRLEIEFTVNVKGKTMCCKCECQTIWTSYSSELPAGVIGRIAEIKRMQTNK